MCVCVCGSASGGEYGGGITVWGEEKEMKEFPTHSGSYPSRVLLDYISQLPLR